jgi:nicotinate-nucleotide pyrophosphorylase (carboxylating)
VSNKKDALTALKSGADIIMLDNMKPKEIKEAIDALKKAGLREKTIIEASGGVNMENIQEYARTGVDVISIGSLTTSYQSFDISLELK